MRKVRAIPHKGKEPYFSFYRMLGFYPDRIDLYQEALTHRSSSIRSNSGKWVNNERLEFLGDAILDAIVADILYKKFENKKEGFLTSTRSRIVQRETLNKIAIEIGIDKIITSSTRNLAHNTNIYGDALEALIGAIYLDQGYRVAKSFDFETLIKQHINIDTVLKSEVDFKSRLIEWGQKYKIDVGFEVTDSSYDEQNNPIFESRVIVGGMDLGSGKGYSKKESHQKAAKKAIKMAFAKHKAESHPRLSGIYAGVQFNLYPCSIEHLGVTMLYAAGSWQFIKFLMARAKAMGWKLKKCGLYDSLTGEPVLHSVDEVYYLHVLGVPYIEWEKRSPGCEFELKSLSDPTRMCKCKLVEDGWEVVE